MLTLSPAPGDLFQLEAEAVRLETDAVRYVTVSELGYETQPARTILEHYGRSSWSAASDSDAPSIFVAADGPVVAQAGSGAATLPLDECVKPARRFVGNHDDLCEDVSSALRLAAVSSQWSVTGNFTVVLWGWQGTIRTSDGSRPFWTGTQATANHAAGIGEVELRQAHLQVTNGVLRLELAQAAAADVYAPTLELVGAVFGPAAGSEAIFLADRGGIGILSRHPVAALAVTPAPNWPIAGGLTALLVAPLGVVMVRRAAARGHLELAQANLRIDNPRAAARHAAKAGYGRHGAEANAIGAIACLRSKQLVQAQRFLADLHASRRHHEADCKYLTAYLRIEQGRRAEGQDLLEQCLLIDPSYSREAADNPVLAPFLDPNRWPKAE